MNPTEFKERFKNAFGELPEGVELDLGKFREFPSEQVESLSIAEGDKAILKEAGFPEDAAPFLSFTYNLERMNELIPDLGEAYSGFRVFGHNGSGDFISIDESDGSICYHNHDNRMQKVFINSSLSQFAVALCLMAEAIEADYSTDFIALLNEVDPDALNEGTFWPLEYEMMKE
ncbi:SUKH-4 family immunity protein [Coraliomargarita sp. SDUM461003]|uniref:SUKH-4 family immunity protein n=1 Tax=Thalassobacterium maritimum TaxID=3041265 RepID=A0ABU1B288_9BACT|nr:SUKH-4 family immunity protein [Coraliomargarita sp. SDUM461003]MDQ8209542.1 SUKH-4 family immunity protein [Coraliomargarita sp. SDUM461003]